MARRVGCHRMAEMRIGWGAGPKWAAPTALYFAVAVTVHFVRRPQWVIRQLSHSMCAVIGFLLLAAGAAAYAWAFVGLRRGLKGGRLVTTGAYSLVRHPLYASSILFILPGVVLLSRSSTTLPPPQPSP